ncbi:MAG: CARDB domain-containing protein [Lachnoclostridium sp.]|jgi:hypothetical protein
MKRSKKIFAAVIAVIFIFSSFSGFKTVRAESYEGKATAINYVGSVDNIKGVPGETVHVKLPVKAINGFIFDPVITVDTENMPFTVSNIRYTMPGYTAENPPPGISHTETTYIEFDLYVKESAKISRNKLKIKVDFIAIDLDDGSMDPFSIELPPVYVIIDQEKEPAQLTVDNIKFEDAYIGSSAKLIFDIKNEGGASAINSYFSIDGYEAAGIAPKYSKLKQTIGTKGKLPAGDTYRVSLPVNILSTATAGSKKLSVKMEYKNEEGESKENTVDIYVNIENNSVAPDIEIISTKYASELKAGDRFNLVATLQNAGKTVAKDIEVSLGGLDVTSFLPAYTSKTIPVKNLKRNEKTDVKIPLIVSQTATVGLKEVPITITYKDSTGTGLTNTTTLYLEVVPAEGVDAEGKPNIVVSNVTQSPEEPNAGARVDVFFDLENKSKTDITSVKISVVSGENAGFTPLSSEPYQYIDKIKGGKKKRITISLMASESVAEGTNSLNIKYDYKDANGKVQSDTATLFIQNVQNSGIGASKPKLIISNFTTDQEELRAGKTFKFIFDIKNTHSSVAARNIKVTVSQAENIFSVTQGSNTFYITQIPAGETVQNTLELRVKSDATTKAYPLEITMDYEYEGAEPNPTTGQIGETVKETINLQAVENTRPVVDNITVGSWDAPVVNQPTMLTFEFYNMGKSPLNNVHATVEGDYTLSTGNMYFIGNVEAGSQEYAEMEVIPTVEGQAKGTLIVTFEDSNGDEVSVTKEFEGTIQGEFISDPNAGMPGVDMPVVPQAKAPIVKTWVFVLIQIAILAVGIPVSKKVRLALYRRKLKKQEEAE